MEEYHKHVKDVRETNIKMKRLSYCGVLIEDYEWHFEDATHAIATIQSGNMLLPCPDCAKAMIHLLTKDLF